MKKFKSKLFCIATEGATTDGRTITPAWIQEMADTFSRKVYGSRVWLEHMRGMLPDGPFKAYGDVMALEARKKDDGKLGLFAQIEPTDDLLKINKARQKIFTSIEVNPDFAGSGKAYLVGLAVTDTPASLGTDMLEFTQKNPAGSPLTARKLDKGNLFSSAEEVEIEFEEVDEAPGISDRIKGLFSTLRKQSEKTEGQLDEVLDAVEEVAQHSMSVAQKVESFGDQVKKYAVLSQKMDDFATDFEKYKKQVEGTDASGTSRPPASGGDGQLQTDC